VIIKNYQSDDQKLSETDHMIIRNYQSDDQMMIKVIKSDDQRSKFPR